MPKPRTINLVDGDGIEFSLGKATCYFVCCDCALTHKITVKNTKTKVQLIFELDNRRTGQQRRRREIKVTKH